MHSLRKKKSRDNIYMYIMIPFMENKTTLSLITITLHINRRSSGLRNGVLTVVSSGVGNGDPGVFV